MGCICSSSETDTDVSTKTAVKVSAPVVTAPSSDVAAPGKTISKLEVAKHNTEADCWVIIGGKVYNATDFLSSHPGGSAAISSRAGKDCTEDFEAFHSDGARQKLKTLYVGDLESESNQSASQAGPATANNSVALDPSRKISVTLQSKDVLSRDTRRFRFRLPNPEHKLGLPVGNHVYISATINGEACTRAYTPTSGVDEVGYFDLVIKVKGPIGHFTYLGNGQFEVNGKQRSAKKIGLICGGTGITPAYQVVKAVLKDTSDPTMCFLVFANQTPDDILLRDDLDRSLILHFIYSTGVNQTPDDIVLCDDLERWAREHPGRFKVHYTVSRVPDGAPWPFSTGHINERIIRDHIPPAGPESFVGMCGPPAMINEACVPNLKAVGYAEDAYMSF